MCYLVVTVILGGGVLLMGGILRNVFSIVGVLLATIFVFSLLFSSTSKSLIWGYVEPVFINNFYTASNKYGKLQSTLVSTDFNNAQGQ